MNRCTPLFIVMYMWKIIWGELQSMSGNLANVSSQTVGNCVLHSVSHKWIPKPYCFMWSSVVSSFQWNFVSSPTKMQLLHNQILQCILHFCLTWSSNNFFVILPCESHITTKMLPNQLFIAFDDNGSLGNQGDECLSLCMFVMPILQASGVSNF